MSAVMVAVARADAVLASADPEQTVSDPERTRVITIAIVAMVVAGVVVLAVTVWFWRSTRPEPAALAPLEVMGQRSFVRADHDEQQRLLERARPSGEEPDVEEDAVVGAMPDAMPDAGPVPSPADANPPVEAHDEGEANDDGEAHETGNVHEDHTPEGDQRPGIDGDEAPPQPAIDPLLGRFQ